jgi:hypothetical protein
MIQFSTGTRAPLVSERTAEWARILLGGQRGDGYLSGQRERANPRGSHQGAI